MLDAPSSSAASSSPSQSQSPGTGASGAAPAARLAAQPSAATALLRATPIDVLRDQPTQAQRLAGGGVQLASAERSSTQPSVALSDDTAVVQAVVYDRQIGADQRLQTLIEAMETRSPEEAQALLAEVLERGGHDVFSVVHLQRLHEQGQLSDDQARVFADAVAGLYNSGRIDGSHIPGLLSATPSGQTGLSVTTDTEAALEGAKLFFGASRSREFARFADSIGGEAINDLNGAHPRSSTDWTTSVIAGLEASGRSDAFLQPYARLGHDERTNVLSRLAEGGQGVATFGVATGDDQVAADGLSIFMRALGAKPGEGEAYGIGKGVHTKWDDLAVEVARFAAENPHHFTSTSLFGDVEILDGRAEALGRLFTGHDEAILDAYTDAYRPGAGTQEPLTDIFVLGNLLHLTTNNPDNAHAAELARNVDNYTQRLARDLGRAEQNEGAAVEALGRVQTLFSARLLSVGIGGFESLENKRALADLVGDIVDLGISIVPVPGTGKLGALVAEELAKNAVGGAAGDAVADAVFDLLQGSSSAELEQLFGQTTQLLIGQLEDIGPNALVDTALANALKRELAELIDVIRDQDYSRYRDALEHD